MPEDLHVRWTSFRGARHLDVSADELLGIKRPRKATSRVPDDPEARRVWRKFQQVLALPEKDRRAVIRLVNSLVAGHAAQRS